MTDPNAAQGLLNAMLAVQGKPADVAAGEVSTTTNNFVEQSTAMTQVN